MAKKQLRVNMIVGTTFFSYGSILDEEMIPPNLRKQKYLADPGEIEPLFASAAAEPEDDEDGGGEDLPPPPPQRRR
jgi:hypothetical protein